MQDTPLPHYLLNILPEYCSSDDWFCGLGCTSRRMSLAAKALWWQTRVNEIERPRSSLRVQSKLAMGRVRQAMVDARELRRVLAMPSLEQLDIHEATATVLEQLCNARRPRLRELAISVERGSRTVKFPGQSQGPGHLRALWVGEGNRDLSLPVTRVKIDLVALKRWQPFLGFLRVRRAHLDSRDEDGALVGEAPLSRLIILHSEVDHDALVRLAPDLLQLVVPNEGAWRYNLSMPRLVYLGLYPHENGDDTGVPDELSMALRLAPSLRVLRITRFYAGNILDWQTELEGWEHRIVRVGSCLQALLLDHYDAKESVRLDTKKDAGSKSFQLRHDAASSSLLVFSRQLPPEAWPQENTLARFEETLAWIASSHGIACVPEDAECYRDTDPDGTSID